MTQQAELSPSLQNSDFIPLISLKESVESLVKRHLAVVGLKNTRNLYELTLAEMEKALLEIVLDITGGNETRTSDILGISRSTLRERRKKFGHYDQ